MPYIQNFSTLSKSTSSSLNMNSSDTEMDIDIDIYSDTEISYSENIKQNPKTYIISYTFMCQFETPISKIGIFDTEDDVRKWFVDEFIIKYKIISQWFDYDISVDTNNINEIKEIVMTRYKLPQLIDLLNRDELIVIMEIRCLG